MVVVVATHSGLVARRDTIRIVHGLGATDSYIAGQFARRATALAGAGGAIGAVAALPLMLALAAIASPLSGDQTAGLRTSVWALPSFLPAELWIGLPALPLAAALIGFATAQGTVRGWLRRLP